MGLEKGCTEVAPLIIIPNNLLTEFLFPIPAALRSAGLEALARKRKMLPLGHITMIPMKGKLRLISDHLGILTPLNQKAKKKLN